MRILSAIFIFGLLIATGSMMDVPAITGAIYFSTILIVWIAADIYSLEFEPALLKAALSRRDDVQRKSEIQLNDPLQI